MDMVGLGWRQELGSSILSNLDEIDLVEVILDDYVNAPLSELRALKTLSAQVPVVYHGVGLGLASTFDVNKKRLDQIAKVVDFLSPKIWSEHLAFVRAGKFEIGHLAAPPRNSYTIEATLNNLEQVKKVVGSLPLLENIATLIDPPNSDRTEGVWTTDIILKSSSEMLLDLNNLYSNAVNFSFDPFDYMHSFPLDKVKLVHLSGGHWISEPKEFLSRPLGMRLIDDHIHDVPDIVFELLRDLAENTNHSLVVIIERDGNYPDFQVLLNQIQYTKKILAEARIKKLNLKRGSFECTSF